jgi:hypothetical protein
MLHYRLLVQNGIINIDLYGLVDLNLVTDYLMTSCHYHSVLTSRHFLSAL